MIYFNYTFWPFISKISLIAYHNKYLKDIFSVEIMGRLVNHFCPAIDLKYVFTNTVESLQIPQNYPSEIKFYEMFNVSIF